MAANDAHYNGTSNLPDSTGIPAISNQEDGTVTPLSDSETTPIESAQQPAPEQQPAEQQPRTEQPPEAIPLQPERPQLLSPNIPGVTVIPIPIPPLGTTNTPEGAFTIPPALSPQYYGQVRFLNASTNTFPVNISIDNYNYVVDAQFGTISNYNWVTDGFHVVTVRRSTGLRSILLQQTLPFVAGEKITLVLTDNTAGNLEMARVTDTGCTNLPGDICCYRLANMAFSGSSFDLMLLGGETIFRNVGFKSASSYKQAVAGTYQFYMTNANTAAFVRELPIIIIGSGNVQSGIRAPLVSFQATLTAGQNFTSYVIGNTWSGSHLQVMTVQD